MLPFDASYLTPDWHMPSPQMRLRLRACILTKQSPSLSPAHLGVKQIQRLRQSHGTRIIKAPNQAGALADGCWTEVPFIACAVVTADCLPIFLVDASATRVALIHAGWRGLAAGILDNLHQRIFNQPQHNSCRLYAAFGAAISRKHFQVGEEVRDSMPEKEGPYMQADSTQKHWYLDLYAMATSRLKKQNILVGRPPSWCTYAHSRLFHSHRRDSGYGKSVGRTINLIWLSN